MSTNKVSSTGEQSKKEYDKHSKSQVQILNVQKGKQLQTLIHIYQQ